jgi:hypothetical protein
MVANEDIMTLPAFLVTLADVHHEGTENTEKKADRTARQLLFFFASSRLRGFN